MSSRPGGLLEREAELSALSTLTDEAHAGTGRVALIEGPPGIGKSELLAAQIRLARERDMTVLVARGGELERDFAFGVALQLFEPAIRSLGRSEQKRLFSGAAALAAPLVGAEGAASAGSPGGDIFPLLHGLYWLSAGICGSGPCMVGVDDVQWSDDPSLRWLHYLARRIEELPLLVVLTARSTEPEGPVSLIEAIRAEPVATTIRPEPLSEPAAAALLRQVFGTDPDDSFTRASHGASGGNPFLLTELARALAADGATPDAATGARVRQVQPDAIATRVLVRLGHLPKSAQELARAMAVLESEVQIGHAAAIAGLGQREAGEAADRLAAAAFVQQGRPLRFTHPLIRGAIYRDLTDSQRAQLHRHAAAILLEAGAPPERVAAHLLLVEPDADPQVVEQLRTAAENAYSKGAPEAAGEYLRRALDEPPAAELQPPILLELGLAESAAARPDAAAHLLEAFALADDPAVRADVAEAAAPFLLASGRTAETLEMLDGVRRELSGRDPDRTLQLDAQLVAAAMLDPSAIALAGERLERAGEQLQGESRGERMMLCYLAYHRMWRSQDAELSADLARRAIAGGRLVTDRGVQPHELTGPVMSLICADQLEAAEQVLDQALQDARGRGSEHAFSFVSCMRSELAYRRGALDEAESEARTGLEITLRSGLLLGSAVNGAVLIWSLIERDELERAADVLQAIGFEETEIPPQAPFNILLSARGRLRVAAGDLDSGLADLLECGKRNEAFGMRHPLFVPWRTDAALVHRARGNQNAARELADDELAAARAWDTPGTIGSAERLVAVLADDPEESIGGLRRAVKLLARSPARLEHARALTDLGAALRRHNQRAEARGPLREALDIAGRCGAAALAERAHAELLTTGARPRREMLSGLDSLTASERRVATLAADGLSNPEIAQTLFVTRKTIETHLGSVYRKLEIGSRDDLPEALESTS